MPTVSAPFGATTTVNLASYIIDDEGNPITVSLTSTLSGTVSTIPSSIFSLPTATSLLINPPSPGYEGNVYIITVKI